MAGVKGVDLYSNNSIATKPIAEGRSVSRPVVQSSKATVGGYLEPGWEPPTAYQLHQSRRYVVWNIF